MLIYATSTNLADWTGAAAPGNAAQLLRSASLLVREATAAACYAVDSTGLPSDPALKQAFNDATCAQVTTWVAAGIDPNAAGLQAKAAVNSKSIGSGSVSYDNSLNASVTAFQARQQMTRVLCDEAARILADAGLIINAPWIG